MAIAPTTGAWLSLRARAEPKHLRPGERSKLVVEAELPPECHIEAHRPSERVLIPTVLRLETVDGVAIGPVRYPPPQERQLDWTDKVLQVYRDTVRFEAPIRVAADAAVGPRTVRAHVSYQGCTPNTCLRPSSQSVEAELEITAEEGNDA